MEQDLEQITARLTLANTPEEVFGEIKAPQDEMILILKKHYRAIAKIVHPDMYKTKQDQTIAQATFNLLTDWLNRAKEKIEAGEYGKDSSSSKIILRTHKREYSIDTVHVEDSFFNFYTCAFTEAGRRQQAVLKIARDPHHNDLVETEVRAIQTLAAGFDAKKFSPYVPNLLDSFIYDDGVCARQAMILQRYEGWYSLEDVHKAYPEGIHPKDMAWMWRRLLTALGFCHANRILHSAVLPLNIWILPEEHGLMLVNWSYAVFDPMTTGECIRAVVSDYADWYPQEVMNKESPLFGTDIQMSAKCMVWLLGGDPQKRILPRSVPAPINAFLKGCILPGRRAPQDAWRLKEEFDELIGKLWGERKFHPFYMK